MIEEGLVAKKKGKTVYVALKKKSRCDTCKACAFGKSDSITMPAIALVECEVGDTVSVQMPTKAIGFAPIILYALPLVFMIIGACIGMLFSETLAVILSFSLLAISLFGAFLLDKFLYRKNPKYNPSIVAVTTDNDGIACYE